MVCSASADQMETNPSMAHTVKISMNVTMTTVAARHTAIMKSEDIAADVRRATTVAQINISAWM